MEPPLVVDCGAGRNLRRARYCGEHLNDSNIGSYEFERDDILLECRVLEDSCEDHFMLLEKRRMTCEELSADVRKGSVECEGSGITNGVSLVPCIDLDLNDVANGGFIG